MNWKKIYLYGGLALAMFFWAFSFIWYKVAFRNLEPIALIFFRLIVASVSISIILLFSGKFEKINKQDYKLFLLLALLEPFLYFIGESYGMKIVSPTMGAIIISFIPLLSPILAYYLFKEKLSWFNYAGIGISFGGVILVLVGKNFILNTPIAGIALMMMAVVCAVGYSGTVFHLAKKYRPMTIIWVQSLIGTLLFLPLFLALDLKETMEIQWSWEVISPILKLGIFPSVLSYLFFTIAIREIGMNKANVFANFIPVIVAVLSFFILKEEMPARKIIGIALVLTGLIVSQRKKKIHPDEKH